MFDIFIEKLKKVFSSRIVFVVVIVTVLFSILIGRMYTLQILGQRHTAPAAATLIMSLESVFAALSGWLILHEILSVKETAGCALVFIAVILAQLKSPDKSAGKNNIGTEKKNEKISQ